MKKLGDFIKEYRVEQNLSLREFAKLCNLSHTYIDKLEKGVEARTGKVVEPTLDVIEKVAVAMNISLDSLLSSIGKIGNDINNSAVDTKEKDIEKAIDELMEQQGLMLSGEPLNEEDLFLLRNSIRNTLEFAKSLKKKK